VTIQDKREWLARQRPIVFYTAGFLFHGDIFIPVSIRRGQTLRNPHKITIKLMLRIKLNSDRFSKVSLARRFDLIGFSHPKASYFLLRGLGNCSCVALTPASMQSKRK
jgi:hypothetical protein